MTRMRRRNAISPTSFEAQSVRLFAAIYDHENLEDQEGLVENTSVTIENQRTTAVDANNCGRGDCNSSQKSAPAA